MQCIKERTYFCNQEKFEFKIRQIIMQRTLFFQKHKVNEPSKRKLCVFQLDLYEINSEKSEITESNLIIGGKAFGIMGTDELRRDLAIGIIVGNSTCIIHRTSSLQ